MDFSKIFKVMNYVVMVLGILCIIAAVIEVAGLGLLSGGDQVSQGIVALSAPFILIPAVLLGLLGILGGRAGLQSDTRRCRNCSIWLAVLSALSTISAIRSGSASILTFISLGLYGFYCYLAHTEVY